MAVRVSHSNSRDRLVTLQNDSESINTAIFVAKTAIKPGSPVERERERERG
jgi:hypothetical protein